MTKSQYADRETLGTQLLATHEAHAKSSPVEANELSHEMGKTYMKELYSCMENHSHLSGDYYILVLCTKPPSFHGGDRALICVFGAIQGHANWQPDMRPNIDCYLVNNEKEKLSLHWSLPDHTEMPMFLESPYEHDPKLLEWIKTYEKIQARRRKE